MDILIRKAEIDEFDKLVDIYRREGLTDEVDLVNKHAAENFKEIGSNRIIWFAEINGQVIGAIQLVLNSPHKDMANGSTIAMIHHLRVSRNHQGNKIGSKLLNTLEEEAKKRNYKMITLEIEKTNYTAKSIYEHWGYKYIKDGTNPQEIIMMKELLKI